MSKSKLSLLIGLMLLIPVLVLAASNQAKVQNQKANSAAIPSPNSNQTEAVPRQNRVSNAVQTMLQISEHNQGIGQQIRTIAQNQNQEMEQIEAQLQTVKQRNGLLRFLIGPSYGQINDLQEALNSNSQKLTELKQLQTELSPADAEILATQIQALEEVKTELESELDLETKGFSLFGWLIRLFTK